MRGLGCRYIGLSMDKNEYLENVHLRILRVTEDLRAIQRDLNCAAMEAPGNPELLEALSADPAISRRRENPQTQLARASPPFYSNVTDFTRLRGRSTSSPRLIAM